jgi:16S rRNA (cytosine967-C5)-methyltransferase
MTPAARVQSAIELLDAIIVAARSEGPPADRIASDWFRARRYAGSGDRRAVRELAWRAMRACGEIPASGRAAMLRLSRLDPPLAELFDGSPHGPAPISPGEPVAKAGFAPAWLTKALAASDIGEDELAALLGRAPLDLRANRLRTTREVLQTQLPVAAEPTAAPDGLRLSEPAQVEGWPQFREGLFEVQDTGSQLACAALAARAGETVIDLCAGAGGKTLALAAALENRGRLIACDTDRRRLSQLPKRADRAGALVETRLLNPQRELETLPDLAGQANVVLIDAPCSGTGTWRRNPETRWRLTARRLGDYQALQGRLLDLAASLVRPGGRVGYVVCSLLDGEGPDQAAAFLSRQPGWRSLPVEGPAGRTRGTGRRLTPLHDGTDGFFFAAFRRL